MISTVFQVFLSNKIGAAGIGLLQMVLSVGSMAMTLGMAGIRTATMYLTAEEIGKKQSQNIKWVLTGCFQYSLICSGLAAIVLFMTAPFLASQWLGQLGTTPCIRLFAVFLPIICMSGVMTGYFTAANRIGTLVIVEVAEQLCSMIFTILILTHWAGTNTVKACYSVILGSSMGASLTFLALLLLWLHHRETAGERIPIHQRLYTTAVPLALADNLRTGISTIENLMVPKRLAIHTGVRIALAEFGTVCGMVFPLLMLPACILYGLSELLIPEVARCNASGSLKRIQYLVSRTLRVSFFYGISICGILFLTADILCMYLYPNANAGPYLRWFSLLTPMLYCDAVTDAMVKGLGQQKMSVRYNILTSGIDVILLFFLLPHWGMKGYFFSFFITHLINFFLSIRLLLKLTHHHIQIQVPLISLAMVFSSIYVCSYAGNIILQILSYLLVLYSVLYLCKIIKREDITWLKNLVITRRNASAV